MLRIRFAFHIHFPDPVIIPTFIIMIANIVFFTTGIDTSDAILFTLGTAHVVYTVTQALPMSGYPLNPVRMARYSCPLLMK